MKKKGRVYEFSDKSKVDITGFWGVKEDLQRRKLLERRSLYDVLRNGKVIFQSSKKKKKKKKKRHHRIFSLAWDMVY